ncbi:glycosyltransferase family 4 protein [Larkinella soli]|uniref:glycosyltransferase family 4 protein n=1 Tax=Larkinella soli TaxID=1770527 RepID=UPI000FFC4572|nr:glycosyltransferase family 4 protein [Larkinella soli]
MKIAVAAKGDPGSVATWSNIPFHIIQYLKRRGHEIIKINLEGPKEPWHYDWYRRYHSKLQKKWFMSGVEPAILKQIGAQFDREVEEKKPDVVLVIHGDFLAYTTFRTPSIIIHDTTFASLLDYYADFTNLTARSIRNGNRMYQLALDRCASAVFSSEWASESARTDYRVEPGKVKTIPLGANLLTVPDADEVNGFIEKRSRSGQLNFLFFGKDYKRKGWADALTFVRILNRAGVKSKLIAVGCEPFVAAADQAFVEVKGFFNKSNPVENEKLENVIRESHAVLLPSLAECYGCVYCEANAYGLPALGRDTGGIPEIIREYRNGLLLRTGESVEEFAERWIQIWNDKNAYRSLAFTSRKEFDERLNYEVFVQKLEEVIKNHVHFDKAGIDVI